MDLFAPQTLAREAFASRKLSLVPVRGDGMEPTLRGEWDYVLAAPIAEFIGDALYVVEQMGAACVFRCQSKMNGEVALIRDNPAYDTHCVPREWFTEHVLGVVVCDLKVRDAEMMRQAWEASQ
jgi:signal peptidase I